jgi:hypothetical protein
LGFLQVQWNTPIYLIDNFASLQRLAMNLYENDNNLIVNPKEKTHSYILSGFEVPFIFILVIQH